MLAGIAEKAFNILSSQLLNYGLNVFNEFHLITKKDHQDEVAIEENVKVFEDIKKFVFKFLDF